MNTEDLTKQASDDAASTVALRDEPAISPLSYEHAITIGWDQHNARRHELIEAKRSRLLSETEIAELAELQWLAGIKRALADGPVAVRDEAETYFAHTKTCVSCGPEGFCAEGLRLYNVAATTPPSTAAKQIVEEWMAEVSGSGYIFNSPMHRKSLVQRIEHCLSAGSKS